MSGVKRSISTDADIHALHKEWDEASCPICMDHPHNAVLLICTSHDKGCRSYICDTSYRHSNCLDQFKKMRADHKDPLTTDTSDTGSVFRMRNILSESNENHSTGSPFEQGEDTERINHGELNAENSLGLKLSLKCPMCRGSVLRWEIIKEARQYLDLKSRSCSRESCSFCGNYRELRHHARRAHPRTRPTDIDMSRLRAWRRLEHQSEYGDLVSALRSAMPGSVVLGDYVIESGSEGEGGPSVVNGPWWTTFFLFQMIGSGGPVGGSTGQSRAWRRHRRSTGPIAGRQFIWGSNLLGLQDNDDDDEDDDHDSIGLNTSSNVGEDVYPPRRRRRLNPSRSGEEDNQ